MAMRPPRIMQRKRPNPYDKVVQGEPGPSTSSSANIADDDINEVLDSSGVYIQDGVMMRIQDCLTNEDRRIQSEIDAAERFHVSQKGRRSITIEDSSGFENAQPYMEHRLPGIADEVEAYPCRYCDRDKVFLTGFGLEKHTRLMHSNHLHEVLRMIRIIHDEWKRRNIERSKIRERVQAVRYRHDSLAMAAAREFRAGSSRNQRRWNADGTVNYVIPSNQLDILGNTAGVIGSAGGPFEACEICNVQINVAHPTAHETHLRAHKRNDELRETLLQEYGQEIVDGLSCQECQLVFTDGKKLSGHNEAMHVRKRKFVCKWCGYVTGSVAELNEHKIDVHAMPPNGGQRQIPMINSRKDVHANDKSGGEKIKNNIHDKNTCVSSGPPTANDETQFSITRTSCPECSLPFNRPSLLLKHMLRVHSKCEFNATIDTKGLPPFTVEVDRGRVAWSCCGRHFNDRVSFGHHRQSHSIGAVSDDDLIRLGVTPSSTRPISMHNMSPPQEEVVVSSDVIKGEEYDHNAIVSADGTIEIVIPRGAKQNENVQYMMIVEQDANGIEGKPKIVAIDPTADPEEVMRQNGIVESSVIQSTSREGMTIDGSTLMEDENGQIIMSPEQFEQFTLQYGNISDLNIVYMEDGNGEENEEGREDDDLQHDILEPNES